MKNRLLLLVFAVFIIASCEKKEVPNIDENFKTEALLLNKSSTEYFTILLTYYSEAKKEQSRLCFISSLNTRLKDVTQSTTNPNQEILRLHKTRLKPTNGNPHATVDPDEEELQDPTVNITGEQVTRAANICHIQSAILFEFNF